MSSHVLHVLLGLLLVLGVTGSARASSCYRLCRRYTKRSSQSLCVRFLCRQAALGYFNRFGKRTLARQEIVPCGEQPLRCSGSRTAQLTQHPKLSKEKTETATSHDEAGQSVRHISPALLASAKAGVVERTKETSQVYRQRQQKYTSLTDTQKGRGIWHVNQSQPREQRMLKEEEMGQLTNKDAELGQHTIRTLLTQTGQTSFRSPSERRSGNAGNSIKADRISTPLSSNQGRAHASRADDITPSNNRQAKVTKVPLLLHANKELYKIPSLAGKTGADRNTRGNPSRAPEKTTKFLLFRHAYTAPTRNKIPGLRERVGIIQVPVHSFLHPESPQNEVGVFSGEWAPPVERNLNLPPLQRPGYVQSEKSSRYPSFVRDTVSNEDPGDHPSVSSDRLHPREQNRISNTFIFFSNGHTPDVPRHRHSWRSEKPDRVLSPSPNLGRSPEQNHVNSPFRPQWPSPEKNRQTSVGLVSAATGSDATGRHERQPLWSNVSALRELWGQAKG